MLFLAVERQLSMNFPPAVAFCVQRSDRHRLVSYLFTQNPQTFLKYFATYYSGAQEKSISLTLKAAIFKTPELQNENMHD